MERCLLHTYNKPGTTPEKASETKEYDLVFSCCTSYQALNGLKQSLFIGSQFCRSEILGLRTGSLKPKSRFGLARALIWRGRKTRTVNRLACRIQFLAVVALRFLFSSCLWAGCCFQLPEAACILGLWFLSIFKASNSVSKPSHTLHLPGFSLCLPFLPFKGCVIKSGTLWLISTF